MPITVSHSARSLRSRRKPSVISPKGFKFNNFAAPEGGTRVMPRLVK